LAIPRVGRAAGDEPLPCDAVARWAGISKRGRVAGDEPRPYEQAGAETEY